MYLIKHFKWKKILPFSKGVLSRRATLRGLKIQYPLKLFWLYVHGWLYWYNFLSVQICTIKILDSFMQFYSKETKVKLLLKFFGTQHSTLRKFSGHPKPLCIKKGLSAKNIWKKLSNSCFSETKDFEFSSLLFSIYGPSYLAYVWEKEEETLSFLWIFMPAAF